MNRAKFLQNRAARLLPVYWLTNFLSIPLAIAAPDLIWGHIDWPKILANFVLTSCVLNSWFAPWYAVRGIMPINGVTWTISTMLFFYLVFPRCLPWMKKVEGGRRYGVNKKIACCYWLQVLMFWRSHQAYQICS